MHDRLILGLGRAVPPSVSSLYAKPSTEPNGQVTWSTSVQGQPVEYASLSTAKQAALNTQIFARLDAIRARAASLGNDSTADPALMRLLQDASQPPPIEAIYSVGDQPVILYWDSAIPSKSRRPVLARPVPPVSALSATRNPIPWLLGLLALLLILVLLWWFFARFRQDRLHLHCLRPCRRHQRYRHSRPLFLR